MEHNTKIGFLFDLDGVLIDSESEYTKIWTKINDRYPTGIENFALKIKGQTLPEILQNNFPGSLHKAVVDMLYESEQKMKYDWLPGAREILEQIKETGYGCVLVTSSNEKKMSHLREELPALEGYFDAIITADKISRSKPDPEGYLLGAKRLGANPQNCAVFEDSRQGVKAGRSAGAYVVGLSTTLPAEQIIDNCDIIINNLSEIDLNKLANILYKK